MQGQQPVLRQSDQQQLLQTTNFVIKMNEVIQPITPVGECYYKLFSFWRRFFFQIRVPIMEPQLSMHTKSTNPTLKNGMQQYLIRQ